MDSNARPTPSLGQIAITVSDVAQAKQFYVGILGLKLLFEPSPELAFLETAGIRLMLTTPQGAGEIGKNSVIYFQVAKIEETFAQLQAAGAEVERPPQLAAQMPDHQLWIGFLRDPDRNLVGLMEEKR